MLLKELTFLQLLVYLTFKQINITDKVGFTSAIPDCDVDFQTALHHSAQLVLEPQIQMVLSMFKTQHFRHIGINTQPFSPASGFNLVNYKLLTRR